MTPTDFYDDVAWFLEDSSVGTRATDIFVNELPATPNDCIAIFGLPGFEKPSLYIREHIYPRFQVVVRASDYSDGAAKLRAVREALHVKIGIMMGNHFVLRSHAEQEGGPIGTDDEGRSEFSINFTAQARYVAPPDSTP